MSIAEWAMDCYTTINRGRLTVELNNSLSRRMTDDNIGDDYVVIARIMTRSSN